MTLPASIWEQAGIVALFVVGFITLLMVLVKLMVQLVKLAIELIGVVKGIISETNSSFQEFIRSQNTQWQTYLVDLRKDDIREQNTKEEAFATRNSKVVEALEGLSTLIRSMQLFDAQHHEAMTNAIKDMRQTVAEKQAANKDR